MKKEKKTTINVQGTAITILTHKDEDYISLTDILKAKDGDFFISDWLRNRNAVELLGVRKRISNFSFNYGEFALIKCLAGLKRYEIVASRPVKETQHHCHTTIKIIDHKPNY